MFSYRNNRRPVMPGKPVEKTVVAEKPAPDYKPRLVVQPKAAPVAAPVSVPVIAPAGRAAHIAALFQEHVADALTHLNAKAFAVNHSPAAEFNGVVSMGLIVRNKDNGSEFRMEFESRTAKDFVLTHKGHAISLPMALLPQSLAGLRQSILEWAP
jgi:hypothetical protein